MLDDDATLPVRHNSQYSTLIESCYTSVMRKIPTLFVRDENDRRYVTREVTPGCEWVIEGEGIATRKFDGTCVKISDDGGLWTRREVKPGKTPPDRWEEVDFDETTGKRVGWEPASQSSFVSPLMEAVYAQMTKPEPGTYELCGPKINGNPEGFDSHVLVPHGDVVIGNLPRNYEMLRGYLSSMPWEGIVWHHPDGRMAKLKRRDFPK